MILKKSNDILLRLKTRINRLLYSFQVITTLIEHVVKNQITPFVESIKSSTGLNKPTPHIMQFSFTDYSCQVSENGQVTSSGSQEHGAQ